MRVVNIDLSLQNSILSNIEAGYQGEHNSTVLNIIPPSNFLNNEKVSDFIVIFKVGKHTVRKDPIKKTNVVIICLDEETTQSKRLSVQLEAIDLEGELISKSPIAHLVLQPSIIENTQSVDELEKMGIISAIHQNSNLRHSLKNSSILKEISEDGNGNITYKGKTINGEISSVYANQITLNTEARHSHVNKSVLDKFTLDKNGGLLFDGEPIKAEGVIEGESAAPKATMAQTVALLLESSETYVSIETPDVASTETSNLANYMFNIVSGFTVIYAPPKDGELTYLDAVTYEPVTIPVAAGGIYEFYVDMDIYEVRLNSYVGEGILDFFKSKLIADKVQETVINANKVSYSNSILEDKSGTIQGALDEVVSFAVTTIPDLEANKHIHANKELLDNAESIFAKKTDLEGIGTATDSIPDYWKPALEEGAEAINTALMTAGYNKSAFFFYSDAHWNYGSQMSPRLLKYLYRHTGITKTNFGGDIVNDEATDYDGMEYLWDWRNQLKDLPNHHSVVGNHDDGNSTNNLFSEQYVYGYLLSAEETPDIVRGDSGLYYYTDNLPEKTRYLYLDTAYKSVNDKQQAFVKEALLSTPEGWHIVAISHIWHDTIYNGAYREVGAINANASILLSMFDNYNSRIGDYAECGGWVEFCIGGHTHLDHDSTSSTGIPIVLVATDSQHTGGGASFTYGTDTEASINGIIADYDNHKIYVIRIGRGESRTIEVTNYVVTYTNVLPTSINTDGSVYNGVGYKANTRWSTSSDTETSDDGIFLSGYIPVREGETIYLKNITMDKNNSNTRQCGVLFFSEMSQEYGYHEATNLTNYNSAVWDDNGILTQFTIVGETIQYIRLQASYMGVDSVVTINEPIE